MILVLKENFVPQEFAKAFGAGFGILFLVWLGLWLTSAPSNNQTTIIDNPDIPSLTLLLEENSDYEHTEQKIAPEYLISGLYKKGLNNQYLPVIRRSDHMKSFHAFEREFYPAESTDTVISLIMVDYGLSDSTAEAVLKTLPEDITFLLSPYSKNISRWAQKAREKNHEIWMGLSVHPKNYPMIDSGPQTLLMNVHAEQNKRRLEWHLSRTQGYAGLISRYNTAMVSSGPELNYLLMNAFDRGLGFVDSQPTQNDAAWYTAHNEGGFYGENDLWIDDSPIRNDIAEKLSELETIAKKKGYAVAFFRPYPTSISQILEWSDTLSDKHIQLGPLTYAVKTAMSQKRKEKGKKKISPSHPQKDTQADPQAPMHH